MGLLTTANWSPGNGFSVALVATPFTAIVGGDRQLPLWRWNVAVAVMTAAMQADKRPSPLSMIVTASLAMMVRLLLSAPLAENPAGGFRSLGLLTGRNFVIITRTLLPNGCLGVQPSWRRSASI